MSRTTTNDGAPDRAPRSASRASPLSAEAWRAVAVTLRLSKRERQIIECLFDDLTEREVAERLVISSHTVHTHIARLYRKLGVRTRCGLAARVLQAHGTGTPIDPPPDDDDSR